MGLLAACGGAAEEGTKAEPGVAQARPAAAAAAPARPPAPPPDPEPATAADSAALRQRVAADSAKVVAAFSRARTIGASEVGRLRQDKNRTHVRTAQRLGVRASGARQVQERVRAGLLTPLGDSTDHWILRDMDHAVPYVTPDARALLVRIGERFHQRLDSLGIPRYRIKVTSALRTDETQAELRKINSYASPTTSSHEFGTTMDISHERFAAPVPRPGTLGRMQTEMLEAVEREHAKVLQAELGRTLLELRDQGMVHVLMENMQPVYHFTVARRMAR
jgi:hypothetical protein